MEFFLVGIFTEFSHQKCIELLFPSIILFITRACGRQSFIIKMPHGRAILVEIPVLSLGLMQGKGGEGELT